MAVADNAVKKKKMMKVKKPIVAARLEFWACVLGRNETGSL
jgi:hypothetical protein